MSDPVFSESLTSLDRIPRNSTQPFSQMLRVSDSDETYSEDGYNSNSSSSHAEIDAIVDLTRISDSSSEVSSPKNGLVNTPCSLIEISDSAHSTPTINCSTINSNSYQIKASAQERLNDFFDNIPDAVSHNNIKRLDNTDESQLPKEKIYRSLFEEGQHVSVDPKEQSNNSSVNNECASEDNLPNIKKLNVNISAKINIKVQVSEQSNESTSESEQDTKTSRQTIKNQQANYHETNKEKLFIDDEMVEILTEIYGKTWKSKKILQFCTPHVRNDKNVEQQPKNNKPRNRVQRKNGVDDVKVSFLESLDEKTPLHKCSAVALKYRTNFKSTKDELLRYLYEMYNKSIFNGKLDIMCDWNNRLTSTAGRCFNRKTTDGRHCKIELSNRVITTADRMRCTLVHEMCHAAAWIYNAENGHGDHWKAWTYRARCIFPELPPITVCHQYEIHYKYTYQCVLCKARHNAHTRSKQVDNFRCGRCHGKIELFMNKKNKNGEVTTKPV